MDALRNWPIALALSLVGAVFTATAAKPNSDSPTPTAPSRQEQNQQDDEELDEVLVEGRKPLKDPAKIIDWLKRLVGQFAVDGSVDLHGKSESGDVLNVQGQSNCVSFFPTSAVQCELTLRWPETRGTKGEVLLGGVSTLDPAIMLYTYESDPIGIRYLGVDSNGIAEGALGYLVSDDTLVSRAKCVNVPGNCERVARITADADLKEVEMKIDLEVDFQKAVSLRFVLHRVPGSAPVIDLGVTK